MGGPIVRTGTTPEFWKNWDKAFGGKKAGKSASSETGTATKTVKAGKKSSTKAAAGKKTKKAAGRKKS
jgi:hypothetical protein